MSFVATHIAGALLRPGALLVVCAALGLLLGRRTIGRVLVAAGVLGLVAILVLPIHRWVLQPLEDRFPPPPAPEKVDGVIVLGGALETFIAADRGRVALNAAAERMTEWVALARRYPQARLVFTGGLGTVLEGAASEAEIARTFADQMGVDPARVTYEGRSRTTYENAVLSFAAIRPAPGQSWLLVTSASHMPRSVGVFRRIGWQVTAWPVGYKTTRAVGPAWLEPFSARLTDLDVAAHEWLGLAAYGASGKIESFLPRP